MGLSGGGKAPELPPVKSVGELTTEATQANINNLPAIMEAYAKHGPEYASKLLDAAQTMNPTLKPLGDLINKRISEVSAGGIPKTLTDRYEQDFRNSQAARGFVDSPASANAEALGLATLGETYANNTMTAANNYGTLVPDPDSAGLDDLGLTPGSIENGRQLAQDANNSEITIAQDEYQRKQAEAKGKSQLIGTLAGIGMDMFIPGSSFIGKGLAKAGGGAAVGKSIGGTFFTFILTFLIGGVTCL